MAQLVAVGVGGGGASRWPAGLCFRVRLWALPKILMTGLRRIFSLDSRILNKISLDSASKAIGNKTVLGVNRYRILYSI